MRVLNLHFSSFSYKTTKSTPVAVGNGGEESFENVLVCLISFEKKDEGREAGLVKSFKENVLTDYSRIKFSNLLLYPYAHLSKSLGSPEKAVNFLTRLEKSFEGSPFKVSASPFGWYKAWKGECKGHPLAEAFREY